MKARQTQREASLAQQLETLQSEFARERPEIAKALEVMNTSMTEYLVALGYLNESPDMGGSSNETTLAA